MKEKKMGVWLGALGRLEVVPEPDEKLMKEFYEFSNSTCPKSYRADEVFANSWYFDEDNRLASGIGKFAEPCVWYDHLKENFFEPRGYQLIGDPHIIGECDPDIGFDFWEFGQERYEESKRWLDKVKNI